MSSLKNLRIQYYGNRLFRAMVCAAFTSILVITPVLKCLALEAISDTPLRQALRQKELENRRELLNQLVRFLTISDKVRVEKIYPDLGDKINPDYSIFQKSLDWRESHKGNRFIGMVFAPVSLMVSESETAENNAGSDPLGVMVFFLERDN
jgi:hypothetical protein